MNQTPKTPDKTQPARTPAHAGVPASSQWDLSTKRIVWVLLLVLAIFVFWLSLDVLPLLILAAIVSYILNPVVDLVARIHIPRSITTIVLYILVLVALVLLPVLFLPVLIEQLRQLGAFDVGRTATGLFNWLMQGLNNLPDTLSFLGIEIPTDQIAQQLETGFQQITFVPTVAEVLNYIQQGISTATGIVSSTAAISVSVVGGIVQTIFAAIVVFFLSLYITKDVPRMRRYVEELFPASYQPELREVLRRMGYIWSAFFRGQIVLSLAVFLVTWLSLRLVGMPGALILAIVAGVLEVIPQIGPTIAMIPAVIVALIQGSSVLSDFGIGNIGFALITIGIYFLIQQVENSVLVPRIIGGSINLHPVVVICGVAVGFNVFGVLGAFLAAPVIASLRVLGSYVHAKLLDYPPFENDPFPQGRRGVRYRRTVTGNQMLYAELTQKERSAADATIGVPGDGQTMKRNAPGVELTSLASSSNPQTASANGAGIENASPSAPGFVAVDPEKQGKS